MAAARSLGLDISNHRSRPLDDVDVAGMDLLVTMERQHSALAVVDFRAPPERTFTLGEIVRLLRAPSLIGDSDPLSKIREIHDGRRAENTFVPDEGVLDPAGRPVNFHLSIAKAIDELTREMAQHLFGESLR
jgi:protein-tyrosine-phosphatase